MAVFRCPWLLVSFSLSFLVFIRNVNCEIEWEDDQDTTGWIDPHEMIDDINLSYLKKKTQNEKKNDVSCDCEKMTPVDCSESHSQLNSCLRKTKSSEEECEIEKNEIKKLLNPISVEQPFFQQYVRRILTLFQKYESNLNDGHYEADISFSFANYKYLSEFSQTGNSSIQEIHSLLSNMMTNIRWFEKNPEILDFENKSWFSGESTFLYFLNITAKISITLIALLNGIWMLSKIRISFNRILMIIILISFLISIPWTWWHLYKKKVAERMAAVERGNPECKSRMMSSIWSVISYAFVSRSDDECTKYFERLEIDPMWEVPPTQAVAVTFTRFFLEPAGHVGEAVRKLFRSIFDDLPYLLWIPVFSFLIFLIIIILFCFCRFQVTLPFIRIGPSSSSSSSSIHSSSTTTHPEIDDLRAENQRLKLQNQKNEERLQQELRPTTMMIGGGDGLAHNRNKPEMRRLGPISTSAPAEQMYQQDRLEEVYTDDIARGKSHDVTREKMKDKDERQIQIKTEDIKIETKERIDEEKDLKEENDGREGCVEEVVTDESNKDIFNSFEFLGSLEEDDKI